MIPPHARFSSYELDYSNQSSEQHDAATAALSNTLKVCDRGDEQRLKTPFAPSWTAQHRPNRDIGQTPQSVGD